MKVLLFANTDWYLYNFRLDLAKALRKSGEELVLLSPPGEYASRLQKLGFRWLCVDFSRRGMNPLREMDAFLHLLRIYRKEKPDLVHHFTIKCVLYGTLAARLAEVGVVVNSITGLGYIFLPGGVGKRFLRTFVSFWYRLILNKTRVVFENDDDRQTFLRLGLIHNSDSCMIPGVGVDTSRFKPSPLPEGIPVVLLAGRLLWDKGIGEYIKAVRLLRLEGVEARFALAGHADPGNPATIPDTQIKAWRDEAVIEWWGWIEDMAIALQKVSIVCLPSYREGLPTVLIEAAACGRPVVASDVPGCRLTVIEGVNGLLVRERESKALAEALRKLIANPPLCLEMGLAGRRLVEEMFSSEIIVNRILGLYAEAVSKGSRDVR